VRLTKHFLALGLVLTTGSALALPIDWNGSLAFDTNLITNIRRTNDNVASPKPAGTGTQGIADNDNGAHFQTYIFKLNPNLIVNDAVSIKGELSSGHARGGIMGDNSTQSQDADAGSNAYYSTVPAQRSSLNVNQLYAELYADTAMVKVGRFAKEFGTGAVLSAGKGTFDRFFTQYDGIQGEMRIGNFSLTPHWARLGTYDDTAGRAEANGSRDVREIGLVAGYDNKNTNLTMALAYSKRFSEGANDLLYSGAGTPRGKTEVTLMDAYIAKKWEKFNLKIEVPVMSGDYGNVHNDGTGDSGISSSAVLLETMWSPNVKWDWGFHAGQVGGDKGPSQRFEGMALNPNYHVTELMFRYNWVAFNEGSNSVFDAHMTNVRFFKLHGHYKTDKWTWNAAVIMATALETAKGGGQRAYHHEENYSFTSTEKQKDDYGTEINAGFDYQWNPNVKLSMFAAYWLVGDYYAYTNTATELSVGNVLGTGARIGIDF
jgi:hypothetical protein